ncbi:hypothetical protein GMLC_12260 [Geomonas limicola]|uniref:Lipoprotein n=1 Tax=Geomonas limicola TaxID=2740186 RepID=A0A6V8N733_9BACT|nr:hypothetical protein [Geomonas limicola]GFO67647.1 hypothetical protein GMLC_12260 [Geomonas limicola]
MKRHLFTAALLGISVAFGCTSAATRNLQKQSAEAIGVGWAPNQIKVSDVIRNGTSLSWTAETPSSKYSCSSDDPSRGVVCTK